jgi:transposase
MASELSDQEKSRLKVLRLRDEGHTPKSIARKLKVSPKFVRNTIDRMREIGSIKDRPRSGRPRKLKAGDEVRLVKTVKGHERRSTRKTAATFKTSKSEKISKSTIHRNLRSKGLIPHRKKRRPKLTEAQKAKRVEFAKEFRRRVWSHTAFWDEKRFELDHPPNPKNDVVWDERGKEYFKEEEKFPKAIMVGMAITSKGPSRLVIYPSTVNAQTFIDNLEGPIADINKLFKKEKWEWIMDKASIHTAKLSRDCMADNVPIQFPSKKWAVNSPDVSAIENVFGYVQDIVDQKNPKDLKSLQRIIKDEFKKLTAEKCQKFISALPGRLKRIIETNGEYCY